MNKIGSVWRHIKSLHDYRVVAVARSIDNPSCINIVYSSLQKSILHGTNETLPVGTCWIREKNDFDAKFIKISDQ